MSCTGPEDFPTAGDVPFLMFQALAVQNGWCYWYVFMYCRSISKATTMGYKEDMGQRMMLLNVYMCHMLE